MSPSPVVSVLIAVELGADWPSWMSEFVGASPRRVLAQLAPESSAEFFERARATFAASPTRSLVLLCNERIDSAQMAARRRLLEGVLAKPRPAKRVLLSASAEAEARLSAALTALVAAVQGADGPPALRFGNQAAPAKRPRRALRRVA
jgi:hypothetical protein